MDNTKEPGIILDKVVLLSANIDYKTQGKKKDDGGLSYCLALTKFIRSEETEGKELCVIAEFDLMHGVETPPLDFKATFYLEYKRQENAAMAWSDFKNPMVLAHAIPYLREFVTNMTARMPVPVLILDPVNTILLYQRYKASQLSAPAPEGNDAKTS